MIAAWPAKWIKREKGSGRKRPERARGEGGQEGRQAATKRSVGRTDGRTTEEEWRTTNTISVNIFMHGE